MVNLNYKLIHERKLANEIVADLNLGKVEVTYSNNALTSLSSLLISLKSQNYFRDLDLPIPDCLLPKMAIENRITSPADFMKSKEADQKQRRRLEALNDFTLESG